MTAVAKELELRAEVAGDCSVAELILPAGYDPAFLTMEACQALLSAQGVKISQAVLADLQNLVAQPPVGGQEPQRVVIARAVPAVDGQDGWVEWTIDQRFAIDPEQEEAINFYARSAYITVKPGDVLGIEHPPAQGVDGCDVLGKAIAAKPGKPAALKLDDSIRRNAKGELVAQRDGMLCRTGELAAIRQLIEIPEHVDFSTGNIDFVGDIIVHGGVRDLFVVKATGSIHVKGLIEAATMAAGVDLVAEGGMAGRSRGSVEVEGNLIARYLDNVRGEVQGNLRVEREAINCDLRVHGEVQSPSGMLIGGRLLIVGAIQVASVGSPAGVSTELILGAVPSLEPFALALREILEEMQKRKQEFLEQWQPLSIEEKRLARADKERKTELQFEIHNLEQRMSRGQTVLNALNHRIFRERTIHLVAHRFIHCGTIITVGENAFRLNRDLHGPVKVTKSSRDIVYRFASGEGGLLAQVADVSAAAPPPWR